jgi:RNA polymerase sigma factor (sigma-70 family)
MSTLSATDQALIKRIRRGDVAALEELYTQAFPLVSQDLANAKAAAEYLQEALIRLREDIARHKLQLLAADLTEHLVAYCRDRFEVALKKIEIDKKVIECLQTGDGWAFYYMQRMFFPSVTALIRLQGGSREDAEDVIMEGIAALLKNIKAGRYEVQDTARLKTYFLRICRNIWVDELKRKKRARPVINLEDVDLEDLEGGYYDALEEDTMSERQKLVRNLFYEASGTCQKVLRLFYYENLSHDEIAQLMGYKNPETSKTQKMKCLAKLKVAVRIRLGENPGLA